MSKVELYKVKEESLPQNIQDGSIYITTDTHIAYVDISDNERIDLNASGAIVKDFNNVKNTDISGVQGNSTGNRVQLHYGKTENLPKELNSGAIYVTTDNGAVILDNQDERFDLRSQTLDLDNFESIDFNDDTNIGTIVYTDNRMIADKTLEKLDKVSAKLKYDTMAEDVYTAIYNKAITDSMTEEEAIALANKVKEYFIFNGDSIESQRYGNNIQRTVYKGRITRAQVVETAGTVSITLNCRKKTEPVTRAFLYEPGKDAPKEGIIQKRPPRDLRYTVTINLEQDFLAGLRYLIGTEMFEKACLRIYGETLAPNGDMEYCVFELYNANIDFAKIARWDNDKKEYFSSNVPVNKTQAEKGNYYMVGIQDNYHQKNFAKNAFVTEWDDGIPKTFTVKFKPGQYSTYQVTVVSENPKDWIAVHTARSGFSEYRQGEKKYEYTLKNQYDDNQIYIHVLNEEEGCTSVRSINDGYIHQLIITPIMEVAL